jgi:hypothetical protein
MLHVDAINLSSAQISQETYDKITAHYNGLPKRPDYDGYVSMLEGIRWAKYLSPPKLVGKDKKGSDK